MNLKHIPSILVAALMLVCSSTAFSANDSSEDFAALSAKLIAAIEASDYDAFVAEGDAAFKQLKKEQFQAISAQLAPKLKAGHALLYLGELKQKGYRVTLWKVSFKDGTDDMLATMSLKEGKVGGFFLR